MKKILLKICILFTTLNVVAMEKSGTSTDIQKNEPIQDRPISISKQQYQLPNTIQEIDLRTLKSLSRTQKGVVSALYSCNPNQLSLSFAQMIVGIDGSRQNISKNDPIIPLPKDTPKSEEKINKNLIHDFHLILLNAKDYQEATTRNFDNDDLTFISNHASKSYRQETLQYVRQNDYFIDKALEESKKIFAEKEVEKALNTSPDALKKWNRWYFSIIGISTVCSLSSWLAAIQLHHTYDKLTAGVLGIITAGSSIKTIFDWYHHTHYYEERVNKALQNRQILKYIVHYYIPLLHNSNASNINNSEEVSVDYEDQD